MCSPHHPDFEGMRPAHEMIERLHREHPTTALHDRLDEINSHVAAGRRGPADRPKTGADPAAS
jgi:hypothetical protein